MPGLFPSNDKRSTRCRACRLRNADCRLDSNRRERPSRRTTSPFSGTRGYSALTVCGTKFSAKRIDSRLRGIRTRRIASWSGCARGHAGSLCTHLMRITTIRELFCLMLRTVTRKSWLRGRLFRRKARYFMRSASRLSYRLLGLVPGGGVEPPRPEGRRILSPLRLPVPPSRLRWQVTETKA